MHDIWRVIRWLIGVMGVLIFLGLPAGTSAGVVEGEEDCVRELPMGEEGEAVAALVFRGGTPVLSATFLNGELFIDRVPVSEKVLAAMRGGFQSGQNGPFLSFGIERSVFLNDKLVSSVSLAIPDVARFAANPNHTFTLVQQGGGNSVPQNLASLPQFMTLLQNSLDHQAIQTHTVINATVTALSWARALDLGHALAQANLNAIRH